MSDFPLPSRARIVIVGAGIVGCSTAYHLASAGWKDIVVLEQGPLFETGGSTSHAPGLVFQTNSSRTMCLLAQQTVKLYQDLSLDDQPCFYPVGSIEIATTTEREQDLKRRVGWAKSWGLPGALIPPDEVKRRIPLLDDSRITSGYWVASDGIAKAVRVCEAMARAAIPRASFYARTSVKGFGIVGGQMRSVDTSRGVVHADMVVICAGIWGPSVGRLAGIRIPLTPVEHQYVKTSPLHELADESSEVSHPILRHQDRSMYFRQHGQCYGIGSYRHEPRLVDAGNIREHSGVASPSADVTLSHPSVNPFTPEHFEEPWDSACQLMPSLRATDQPYKINGMFSFTPDGFPVLGESSVKGLWVAEAVWVTHGGGVGRAMAEWLSTGTPALDLRECDINRFDPHVNSMSYVRARGAQQYREVYDIIHPLQQVEHPRPLRVSPFYHRQRELGAVFFEGRGWERAQWFESNRALVDQRVNIQRPEWAAKNWSPIAGAEHLATRERAALFDMTPLIRISVAGKRALELLQYLTSNQLDKPIGSVVYTSMLNEHGKIKSDVTVSRLGEQEFQVGCNGLQDLAWLRKHAGDSEVSISDITRGTCCVGLWGPRARLVIENLVEDDWSDAGFPYFTARRSDVGEVPVMAQRLSYVGELGWEIYTTADYGQRLWDLLWQSGKTHGMIAAGRSAFESLRIEKGYRLWGTDMYSEHTPYEAGIAFTVKSDKGEFVGRSAVLDAKQKGTARKLSCMTLDDPSVVVMGKEPILHRDRVIGYVTSAAYGFSVEKSIAYGYLPIEFAGEGNRVEIEHFSRLFSATVSKESLYDPKGLKLKS